MVKFFKQFLGITDASVVHHKYRNLFKHPKLFEMALRHTSHGAINNERLEWLGDAVLRLIVNEYLYHTYPSTREGVLTQLTHALLSNKTLSEVARHLKLAPHIKQSTTDLDLSYKIYADTLEALVGALYIDRGLKFTHTQVLRWLKPFLDQLPLNPHEHTAKTHKSMLKEYIDACKLSMPVYEIWRDQSARLTYVRCTQAEKNINLTRSARNRKMAEELVAEAVLRKMRGVANTLEPNTQDKL